MLEDVRSLALERIIYYLVHAWNALPNESSDVRYFMYVTYDVMSAGVNILLSLLVLFALPLISSLLFSKDGALLSGSLRPLRSPRSPAYWMPPTRRQLCDLASSVAFAFFAQTGG